MKRKISVICSLLACLVGALLFAGCADFNAILGDMGLHSHNYKTEWLHNATYHWHECQNIGCNERQIDKEAHVDEDENGACDVCGYTPKPAAHSHDYRWVDNGDGTHKQHCAVSGCNEPDISLGEHVFDADGRCVCGALDIHVHNYKWVNNGDGTHKQHCDVSDCDEPDISEAPHAYDEDGVCICGVKKPAEGHEHYLTPVPEREAGCTTSGTRLYYTCSGCDLLFADSEAEENITLADVIIGALGHNYEAYESDGNATCVDDGTMTAECSRCHRAKDTIPDEGSALGHNYVTHDGQAPSCNKAGWKSYETCTRCNYTSYEEIPAIGHHTWKEGICDVCGEIDWTYEGLNLMDLSRGTYGYDYLGTMSQASSRQSLYDAIDEAVRAVHRDVDTDYNADVAFAQLNYVTLNLSGDDAVSVWKTYLDDNPLYYWFSNKISYNKTSISLYIDTDYVKGDVRKACNRVIFEKIQEYLSYAEAETSTYQIALAFHDKILTAIDYAYDSSGEPQEARWAHNIMGVFEEEGAVCEGYAKSFQLLLNLKGIDNLLVDGLGAGGPHAWNLVKLDDGQWYWCDLTWDDVPGYEWGIRYQFFCVNDTQGVDWNDGSNQRGDETGNDGIGGSPKGCETFLSKHEPYSKTGTDIKFLYELPARSKTVYKGVGGELLVRDTFTVGSMQYAVTGYHTVQVTKVPSAGDVVIDESVTYLGAQYKVIAIGAIGGTKLFGANYIIESSVTSLTIPSTVVFIWSLTFYRSTLSEITFTGTMAEWKSIEKLSSWKNPDKRITVHCVGGDVTE